MIDWYDYTNTFHKKTFPNDGNLDSLSEEYQRELASIWRLSDVYNGGYIQFIGNWGLVTHRYAVKALENIGAVKKETILKDCYSALMKYYIDGKGYTEIRDCIPNAVSGVHEKDILPLIIKYKDIYSLLGNIHFEELSDKWKKAFKDNEKQLRVNYQLVNFIETSYEEIKEYITESKLSISILKELYLALTPNIKEVDKRDLFFETKKSSTGFFDEYKLERL